VDEGDEGDVEEDDKNIVEMEVEVEYEQEDVES
jgi:hypothetical protein